jgi:hypothetical protein
MKRLIDDDELSGAGARLAELVRHSERFEADPARKRSILLRLRAPAQGSLRLRGTTLAVALLCVGTAGAAVGYDWIAPNTAPRPAERADTQPPRTSSGAPSKQDHQPVSAAVVDPPAPRVEAAPERPARAAVPKSRTAKELAHQPGEDPAPVLDAIRALRKSRDPARAQRLLDDYLTSNPRGALSEDALGLAIEAAAARGDPKAADYARRYLSRFPNGRFRAIAVRAAQQR